MKTERERAARPGIEISEARWPIVEIRLHEGLGESDIDAAYDELERIARRRTRHAHWTDLRDVQPLGISANLRKRFAEREQRLFPLARGVVVGDMRIVDRPVVRGLLTAFEWLTGRRPPRRPRPPDRLRVAHRAGPVARSQRGLRGRGEPVAPRRARHRGLSGRAPRGHRRG